MLCFADRVQVIASAGSGKTSTMVAKAGYALHAKLVDPEEILLLAFNKDAAEELQERVRDRLRPLGLLAEKVVARTFHGFGLDVIGHATGRRPKVAPWVEHGQEIEHLAQLVDTIRYSNAAFRRDWDLFRLVFGTDLSSIEEEESDPEDWERATRTAGFRTNRGEVVRSRGERHIANWLYYNGVDYRYEQPYEVDLASPTHRQYCPDFYYPSIQAYHEHWALDMHGKPPKSFVGYAEGMRWKREQHEKHSTMLLETTSAQVWSGEAFAYLACELTARGIVLEPRDDRPIANPAAVDERGLLQLIRTFLVHAKSNRLDDATLGRRLDERVSGPFRYRHELFLRLFRELRVAWDRSLAESGFIDFEDMLLEAASHLNEGRWESPFELIMVDEFQDVSQARAQLVRSLLRRPTSRLFAVGDDWQSINRFAGADISVMTGFEGWFGKAEVHRLERTFRCPQSICDISSTFVQENPNQLRKKVYSDSTEHPPAVRALQVPEEDRIRSVLLEHLQELHDDLEEGTLRPGARGKVSVLILGRYNRDSEYLPSWGHLSHRLDVKFLTVHGSKGLEADYVILPRITAGAAAFPSTRKDDPILMLVMPHGDSFPQAEERRLFYVALTRARRSVLLITLEHRFSPFIVDLINAHGIEVMAADGEPVQVVPCPEETCTGVMVPRSGVYGTFFGCTRFPACRKTMQVRARAT